MKPTCRLIKIYYYEAPLNRPIIPRKIRPCEEYFELITAGGVHFNCGGRDELFGGNTLFRHCAGESTVSRTDEKNPYRCLALLYFNSSPRTDLPRAVRLGGDFSAMDFARSALESFHDDRCNREILGEYLHAKLLWEAARSVRYDLNNSPVALLRAADYIRKNSASIDSISRVAKYAGVSESHLFLLFRRFMDTTPHRFLLNEKLTGAKKMLCSTATPIKEISRICGFDCLESFYRAFRKSAGVTPVEYRRRFEMYGREENY